MATLNYDYSFTPNTAAKATEVNGNFNRVKEFTEAISTGVNIDAGSISTVKIADGAVATAKLANDAVTTSKIVNAAVTTDKLVASVPRGKVAYETRNTNTSSASAVNCFSGITFTPVVGRLYRVSFGGHVVWGFTDYSTTFNVAFVDGSNNVLQYIHVGTLVGGGASISLSDSYLIAPSTTTAISLNVRAIRTAGTDTLYFNGAADKQNYILVEDIGAA